MKKQIVMAVTTEVTGLDEGACPEAIGENRISSNWSTSDWLTYYSQCCNFLLNLGAKFISLLAQASVYTTAVCAAIITMRRDRSPSIIYLLIGIAASLPLLCFWHFISRYRKQIQETGNLIYEIENKFVEIGDDLKLLHRLRVKAPIYGLPRTAHIANVYPVLLIVVLISLGAMLSSQNLDKYFNTMSQPPAPVSTKDTR